MTEWFEFGYLDEKSSGKSGEQGPPGVGFHISADGNYDLKFKKLIKVSNPDNDNDATTKNYVDDKADSIIEEIMKPISNCMATNEHDHFNARGKKIGNLKTGQNQTTQQR